VEVVGHKAHGAVPQPGSVVIARVRSISEQTVGLTRVTCEIVSLLLYTLLILCGCDNACSHQMP
jgi:hypothetical protein